MHTIKKYLPYVPLLLLAYMYAAHAAGVFFPEEAEEYTEILETLGFSATITTALVWAVLPIDGTVALLLLFGNKLCRHFPWNLLFLWATLWPWVPRVIAYRGGVDGEIWLGIVVSVLALISWYLYKKQNAVFFTR